MLNIVDIIIPDLHGDFYEFINILLNLKILKTNKKFIEIFIDVLNNNFNDYNFSNYRIIQLGDILDSLDRTYDNKNLIKYSDLILFIFLIQLKINYPNNIILLLGNHEYMNIHGDFSYVNNYSQRNNLELIKKMLKDNFLFYFFDYNYFFIHAMYVDLDIINYYKNNLFTTYSKLFYNSIFSRIKPNLKELDKHNIERIFFGHTPSIIDYNNNERIFYLDETISHSFDHIFDYYRIILIKNKKIKLLNIKRLNYEIIDENINNNEINILINNYFDNYK